MTSDGLFAGLSATAWSYTDRPLEDSPWQEQWEDPQLEQSYWGHSEATAFLPWGYEQYVGADGAGFHQPSYQRVDAFRLDLASVLGVASPPQHDVSDNAMSLMLGQDQQLRRNNVANSTAPVGMKHRPKVVSSTKWVNQLRALLDFYFEPFSLQHNRVLVDLITRLLPQSNANLEIGPVASENLLAMTFHPEELTCLARIEKAYAGLRNYKTGKLDLTVMREFPSSEMKHLVITQQGFLSLASPPELRRHVGASGALPEEVAAIAKQMYAPKEVKWEIKDSINDPGLISCCSYSLLDGLAGSVEQHRRRQARIKRQLDFYTSDLVLLQASHIHDDGWTEVLSTLLEQGYECIFQNDERAGQSNVIFFRTNRLTHLHHEVIGSAVAAEFSLKIDGADSNELGPAKRLWAVSMKPQVPASFDPSLDALSKFRKAGIPLLVGGDFTEVGGAEAASIVEGTCGLRSLAYEVFGQEVSMPLSEVPDSSDGGLRRPVQSAASRCNRLHCPDGIFFEGLEPILALSGHSERYLATLQDVIQQFPSFHLPLVGCFRCP